MGISTQVKRILCKVKTLSGLASVSNIKESGVWDSSQTDANITPEGVIVSGARRSRGLFPNIDPIVRLLAETTSSPFAAVMLITGNLGKIVSKYEECDMSIGPRKASFCLWCLRMRRCGLTVIEDTTYHPTVWHHNAVVNKPRIKFYMGLPLLGTDGLPIGAVCLAGYSPRVADESLKDAIIKLGEVISNRLSTEVVLPRGDCLGVCNALRPECLVIFSDKTTKSIMSDTRHGTLREILKRNSTDILLTETMSHMGTAPEFGCEGVSTQPIGHNCEGWLFFRFMLQPTATTHRSAREPVVLGSDAFESPFQDMCLGACLGTGSFGTVYMAEWQKQKVAVKVLTSDKKIEDEVNIGLQLSHPNVAKTIASEKVRSTAGCQLWIVLEYCAGGSLHKAVFEARRYCTDVAGILRTSLDICKGLAHIHDRSILHGDLTGNNILLDSDGTAKIIDFGLSRRSSGRTQETEQYGTMAYMPPELLNHGLISKAMDIYSLGVIMWELSTGHVAYADMRPSQILSAKILGTYRLSTPESVPAEFADLVMACLSVDYRNRPDVGQVRSSLQQIATKNNI